MGSALRVSRNERAGWLGALATVLVLLVMPVANGQTTQPVEDEAKAAQAAYEKLVERYRGIKTYQDELELTFEMKVVDRDGDDVGQRHDETTDLKYARPKRVAYHSNQLSTYSDGEHVWWVSDMLGQYIEQDAKDGYELTDPMMGGNPFGVHPVMALLLIGDGEKLDVLPGLKQFTKVTQETRDGHQWQVIHGTMSITVMPGAESVPVQLWVGADDGLLSEIYIDLMKPAEEMLPMMIDSFGGKDEEPKLEKAYARVKVTNPKIDVAIPDDAFAYKPEKDLRKVKEFNLMAQRADPQVKLLGELAPDFSGETFDGKPFKLSELRGKVVVLDFWATWCGPCMMAIPHIQKLHETYKDQGVVVVGVNRDSKGAVDKVKASLEKNKVTFAQFMDAAGDVAGDYKVNGIPCTVMIDKEGKIADIHTGYGPGMEKEYAENVEKLIKGEPIYSEEELKARKADAAGADDDADVEPEKATSAELGELAAETLTEGDREAVQGTNAYQARRVDVDGDGKAELVLPTWQGRVYVVSADGTEVDRLVLKGLRGQIQTIDLVRVDGEPHWLIGSSGSGMRGDNYCGVTVFNRDGDPLWQFTPEIPEDFEAQASVQAADLDGNGTVEYVVGLMLYRLEESGDNMWTQENESSYLIILNAQGERVAQKEMGGQLGLLRVAEPDKEGRRAVLWFDTMRMHRVYWQPGKALTAGGE